MINESYSGDQSKTKQYEERINHHRTVKRLLHVSRRDIQQPNT
jgi:hypothetical protein